MFGAVVYGRGGVAATGESELDGDLSICNSSTAFLKEKLAEPFVERWLCCDCCQDYSRQMRLE